MTDTHRDFIRSRVEHDLAHGMERIVTRFPPEPNGYLHIGHAKSICLNFGIAEEYGGIAFLRYDDTNPLAERTEYIGAIQRDVVWLGFDWEDRRTFASDYFDTLHACAVELVEKDLAFVCSLSQDEIRASRGTLTEPGSDSPYRNRSVAENLELFAQMKAGRFPNGAHVLRAKIDMASPNLNLRDPVLYRIRHVAHASTGNDWVIYPTYDFTHCICDALENITHSLCTLEFEDHRALYDWVLDNLSLNARPQQIEFSRLGLEYTVMSKRLLQRLVSAGVVAGWDDPRMPTLAGLRRRGVTPGAIRDFCSRVGVTKQANRVELELLEFCIRQALDASAPRGMAVAEPLKVVLVNYSSDGESLEAPWHPRQAAFGARDLPFGREIWIDRSDFAQEPPKGWKRLSPGGCVRLRYAYIIRCDEVVLDNAGEVSELRCTWFANSRSGADRSGIKPAGVIHWVDSATAVAARLRLYDRLFNRPDPSADDLLESINPDSLVTASGYVERAVAESDQRWFQFERTGYFFRDPEEAGAWNRTVTLRSSWRPPA